MGLRERSLGLGAAILVVSLFAPWNKHSAFGLVGPLETWAGATEGEALLGVRLMQLSLALLPVTAILAVYEGWSSMARWPTVAAGAALAVILLLLIALGFPGLDQNPGAAMAVLGAVIVAFAAAWRKPTPPSALEPAHGR